MNPLTEQISNDVTPNADIVESEVTTLTPAHDTESITEGTPQSTSEAKPSSDGFAPFGFAPEILEALVAMGYSAPSPIQKAAIPELLLGRDLVGQAQTGTGKPAAFALPILARL